MGKVSQSKEEQLRERVYKFYDTHKKKGRKFVYSHFVLEGISKSTLCGILNRYDQGIPAKRIKGSGRISKIFPQKQLQKLKQTFDHKDGVSQKQVAMRFRCSQSYICKVLKKKTDIRCRKKKRIPCRTDEQRKKIKTRCGRLYNNYKQHIWLMDDESFFTLKNSTINGNSFYYSSNINQTPSKIKHDTKKKFEDKILVWVCISSKGISSPYFLSKNQTINKDIYLNQCLKKKLIPFIKEIHKNDEIIFWPDLSTSHYSKIASDYLKNQNVNYVQKDDNPPNVPEARPIEDFWYQLKGMVYKNNWEAKNIEQLKRKIRNCIKIFDLTKLKQLMNSIPKRLNKIRRYGVIEQR